MYTLIILYYYYKINIIQLNKKRTALLIKKRSFCKLFNCDLNRPGIVVNDLSAFEGVGVFEDNGCIAFF